MGASRTVALIVAAGAVLAACQAPMQTIERTVKGDPGKPYYGLTKEQIIACAGQPRSTYQKGSAENLTYRYSGAGPIPSAAPKKQDKPNPQNALSKPKEDKNFACSATLTFEQGRLTNVTYAPAQVVSPYETKTDPKTHEKIPVPQPQPCTFSLPNCAAH
jgi:hypothetical protein